MIDSNGSPKNAAVRSVAARTIARATCFGDSGGPVVKDGFVTADTSYGFTNNCRYLGGYQRVDIPIVLNWLLDCMADPACSTKA